LCVFLHENSNPAMKLELTESRREKLKTAAFIFFLLVYLGLFLNAGIKVISRPVLKINSDAVHYFKTAYNLVNYGTFSQQFPRGDEIGDESYRPRPTAKREPGYPVFISPAFFFDPTLRGMSEGDFVFEDGELILPSKAPCWLTLAALFLTSLLGMWVTLRFTRNRLLSIVALFGIGLSPAFLVVVRQLLSENLAALLLLGFSFTFYLSVKKGEIKYYAVSGLLLGVLVLTKGVFQFAWIVAACFILIHHLLKKVPLKRVAGVVFLFLLSYFIVVLPWMGRNYRHFGRAFITERGGGTLVIRAVYNDMMTPKDYAASFIYWVPTRYTEELAVRLFGRDVINRLDVTHPDSIHSSVKAIRAEKAREYENSVRADSAMISMAVSEIKSHPFRHLIICFPFAWKGIFVEIDDHFFIPASLISLLLFTGFFAFTLRALIKREWEHVALVLPSLYLFGMHMLLTWCNPRYNKPMIPVLWIASLFVLQLAWQKISRRFEKSPDPGRE